MLFKIIGIVSACVLIVGDTPYIKDTMLGTTKPHRVTWGIIVLMNGIGFANQWASGATNSLWIYGASLIVTGAIFLVSLRKGVGGHSKIDIFSVALCFAGLGLWAIFNSPLMSILTSIFVDIVALRPSFAKAKKQPESETKISWLVATISTTLAAISVGKLDIQLLLLPITATLLQGYMVYILYVETRQKIPAASMSHQKTAIEK